MTVLDDKVSIFVEEQIPGFIKDQYPLFVQFLKAYFSWLEDSGQGAIVYHIRNLLDYTQIDSTTDQFIQHFKNNFLPYFPDEVALDEKKLLKLASKFFNKKGTEESVKFLFRVLYNKEAEVYFPRQNVLKTSDGKWQRPLAIKIVIDDSNRDFDFTSLEGRYAVGSISETRAVIEKTYRTFDPLVNSEVVEIYVSNINRDFQTNEQIIVQYGADVSGNPLYFYGLIVGSVIRVDIDSDHTGSGYTGRKVAANGTILYTGDPLSFYGGFDSENPQNVEALAYVGNVTSGQIKSVALIEGGYGYRNYPNTIVEIISDSGSNGQVIVTGIDPSNVYQIQVDYESINYKANTSLDSLNFGFANNPAANIANVIAEVLSFSNINVSSIIEVQLVDPGEGYLSPPEMTPVSFFDTDYSNNLYATYVSTPTNNNYETWLESRQNVTTLGRIADVDVISGGFGYSNTKDAIYFSSPLGYSAAFDFITNGSGTITKVLITNHGFGYIAPALLLANSANVHIASNGVGASLIAYVDGTGAEISKTMTGVGQIEDIILDVPGYGYVKSPNVSVRVQDIVLSVVPTSAAFYETEHVWQGSNYANSTFRASVDYYDGNSQTLRVYDYSGTVNVSLNLSTQNTTVVPLSANVYGDGLALANVVFNPGLIRYPGFWINTDGRLSSDQFLQDDQMYHNYSYIIKVEEALKTYKNILLSLVHPAGTKMFGINQISDTNEELVSSEWLSEKLILGAGNVTIDAVFASNAYMETEDSFYILSEDGNGILLEDSIGEAGLANVTGHATTFTDYTVGQLLVIAPGTTREQSKIITVIYTDTLMTVESSTLYESEYTINMINNSSNITTSAPLIANDIFLYEDSNVLITTKILSVNGNLMTTNASTYSSNAEISNVWVLPFFQNVSYGVI